MNKLMEQAKAIKSKMDADGVKATDFDIIVKEIMKLPKGQLKKVLTAPVLEVLAKYGYTTEE